MFRQFPFSSIYGHRMNVLRHPLYVHPVFCLLPWRIHSMVLVTYLHQHISRWFSHRLFSGSFSSRPLRSCLVWFITATILVIGSSPATPSSQAPFSQVHSLLVLQEHEPHFHHHVGLFSIHHLSLVWCWCTYWLRHTVYCTLVLRIYCCFNDIIFFCHNVLTLRRV